jgi:hypothetical protein
MFGKYKEDINKEIHELWSHIDQLSHRITAEIEEMRKIGIMQKDIENFKLEINKRLDDFHKSISDKYIKAIEDVLHITKETMLIDTLIKQVSEKDINNLRRVIMQPIIEERIKEADKNKSQAIESNIQTEGGKLLELKKKLHAAQLQLNREGKDTKFLEGQLDILNQISKEVIQ